MIRKITLENYMAHVRTVIEPVAGLTVLIGPNNCGKSAVAHALEMICYNSDAATFAIRHGTKKATVTVETEDDDGLTHTLVWWRTRQTSGYVIDGREISGIGRGKVPDDLHRYLRMPAIPSSIPSDPFLIHLGLQKQPIFLLDNPGSRAAQFFASHSDADHLIEMQRRHKLKQTEARRDRERLDLELAALDQQLETLSPLDEIAGRLARLEARYAEITQTQARLAAMAQFIELFDAAEQHEAACAVKAAGYAKLQQPPQLDAVAPLAVQIDSMTALHHQTAMNEARTLAMIPLLAVPLLKDTAELTRLIAGLSSWVFRVRVDEGKVKVLDPLQTVPGQFDARVLRDLILEIEKAQLLHARLKHRSEKLSELSVAPKWPDLASMRKLIESLARQTDALGRFEARSKLLGRLVDVPKAVDPKPLTDLVGSTEKAVSWLAKSHASVQRAEKNLSLLIRQIEKFVESNPQCPSCGQVIGAELILAGGHSHG